MNRFAQLRSWFDKLKPRERLTVLAGLILGVPLLFYVVVWAPLRKDIDLLQTNVDAQALNLEWMKSAAAEVRQLRDTRPISAQVAAGGSLLGTVNATAERAGVARAIQRMNPQGEDTLELQIDNIAFDALMRWLGELETGQGIRASFAALTRTDAEGQVNARLTLQRNP